MIATIEMTSLYSCFSADIDRKATSSVYGNRTLIFYIGIPVVTQTPKAPSYGDNTSGCAGRKITLPSLCEKLKNFLARHEPWWH